MYEHAGSPEQALARRNCGQFGHELLATLVTLRVEQHAEAQEHARCEDVQQ